MTTTSKTLKIIGSKDATEFTNEAGEIPEDQIEIANKLKDLVLLCLLFFENNTIVSTACVSFSAKGGQINGYDQDNLEDPFKGLIVENESIIACNFAVDLNNIKGFFEKDTHVRIKGIICPAITEQAKGFLLKHKNYKDKSESFFIVADEILSDRLEVRRSLLSNNENLLSKFSNKNIDPSKGIGFIRLTMNEAKKFF